MKNKPSESIKYFNKAIFVAPANEFIVADLDAFLQHIGRNPESFKDRLQLGDSSKEQNDLLGAFVEYKTAQCIEDDVNLSKSSKNLCSKGI